MQERDSLIEDIDKVLMKVQGKSGEGGGRSYEKMMESRTDRRGREEEVVHLIKSGKGEGSARSRLQEYKQLVNKLDTI